MSEQNSITNVQIPDGYKVAWQSGKRQETGATTVGFAPASKVYILECLTHGRQALVQGRHEAWDAMTRPGSAGWCPECRSIVAQKNGPRDTENARIAALEINMR